MRTRSKRRRYERAVQRWLLAPSNTPQELKAWNTLYDMTVSRPWWSRNATIEDDEPVMLP